jgi:hypothetical protein
MPWFFALYQLMDSWVHSTFWTPLWTFMYKFLCGHMLSDLLGIWPVDHMLTLCLLFWRTSRLFYKVAAPFYILTGNMWCFQLLYIPISLVIIWLFRSSHPSEREVISHCSYTELQLGPTQARQGTNSDWCWWWQLLALSLTNSLHFTTLGSSLSRQQGVEMEKALLQAALVFRTSRLCLLKLREALSNIGSTSVAA